MKDLMIEDFEKKEIVPLIVGVLETKIGIGTAVKCQHIVGYLAECGHKVDPGRFRLMINYIRSNDLVIGLVASQRGYYRTSDPAIIAKWIDKEMGIIKQKVGPLKRMRLYLHELAHAPGLQMK
jgi:hypothetical protein